MSSPGQQRHILVGVTGGIAAYKTAELVSLLVKRGDAVTVAMTDAACRFIGQATLEALSGRAAYRDPWTSIGDPTSQHVALAGRADAMVVAPCSMHSLAKFASGMAADAVSLLVAAVDRKRCPVLLAPSMNAVMLAQPATCRNIDTLRSDGFTVMEPDVGWQACRTDGCGRMPEPTAIVAAIDDAMTRQG
ncbi:MAG: flavoprotein [Phycisphaerales bacterium]|jgi:phosphopantothenoylcysteine decarboxylase/phosphopantothenate--cysteine ligase|nr:flavoprotein [Phycisphaerales bacterium]